MSAPRLSEANLLRLQLAQTQTVLAQTQLALANAQAELARLRVEREMGIDLSAATVQADGTVVLAAPPTSPAVLSASEAPTPAAVS